MNIWNYDMDTLLVNPRAFSKSKKTSVPKTPIMQQPIRVILYEYAGATHPNTKSNPKIP